MVGLVCCVLLWICKMLTLNCLQTFCCSVRKKCAPEKLWIRTQLESDMMKPSIVVIVLRRPYTCYFACYLKWFAPWFFFSFLLEPSYSSQLIIKIKSILFCLLSVYRRIIIVINYRKISIDSGWIWNFFANKNNKKFFRVEVQHEIGFASILVHFSSW